MGAGVVACGTSNTGGSSSTSLPEGLTILSGSADTGISAAFKENGRVVYLQTLVGPMKSDNYLQGYPNDPQHEMDARVVDQEGRTFELVVGGDQLIDPSWAADIKSAAPIQSAAEGIQRQADFLLGRDAAKAFAAQARPELADHVYHLANMTRVVPQEDLHLQARAATVESKMPAGERPYGGNGCSSNTQEGDLYWGPLGGLTGSSPAPWPARSTARSGAGTTTVAPPPGTRAS